MKRFYTVKEAAKLLGVSTNTIYAYLGSGEIKAKRIGKGRFKIPYSEVRPFLNEEHEESFKHFSLKLASKDVLSEFKGTSYEVRDFIFFKLFLAIVLFGAGILIPFSDGQVFISPVFILVSLATIFSGLLIFGEIFLPSIFEKYEFKISVFSLFILGVNTLSAFYSGRYEAFIGLLSLFIVVVSQVIRGCEACREKGSFEKEFLRVAIISFSLAGVLTLVKPNIFPLIVVRTFIVQNTTIFTLVWFVFGILPIALLSLRRFKNSNLDLVILPIMISWGVFFAIALSLEAKWLVFYFVYIFNVFSIFLLWWRRTKRELTQKSASLISISFIWVMLVLFLCIGGTAFSQGILLRSRVSIMETSLSEISRGLNSMFDTMDRRLTQNTGELEISSIIASGNKEAAIAKSKQIFDAIPDLRRVTIQGRDGIVLGAYPREPLLQGTDLSSRDYFQAAKETQRPYTTSLFTAVTGVPIVLRAYPVIKNGVFIGLVGLVPDLQGLSQKYQGILSGVDFFGFDKNGKYIFHPDFVDYVGKPVDKNIIAQSQKARYQDVKTLRVFNTVKTPGWTVYLESATTLIFADLLGINIVLSIVILVNAILSFSIMFIFIKKWVKD